MAVHLAAGFWKGCWERVCGHAFQLVFVFVREWRFESCCLPLCNLGAGQGRVCVYDAGERRAMLLRVFC